MIETNASDVADELLDEFDDFEDEFEEERDRALREAKDLAQRRVPVDEGDLRADISIDLDDDRIFNTLPYAARINWGFFGTDSLGRDYSQEGTFYMTDSALDAWRNSIDRLQQ